MMLLLVGCGRAYPNLAKTVRGVSKWYEVWRQAKMIQNEGP